MPEPTPLTIQVTSITYRDPFVFVGVRAHWDEGHDNIGAATLTLELPLPPGADQDPSALRESVLDAVRASIDFEKLRLWRGPGK